MTQATLGHNKPPLPLAPTPEEVEGYLFDVSQQAIDSKKDLMQQKPESGFVIENEDQAEGLTSFIKKINSCKKDMESIRTDEKKPYLDITRTVDSFFKQHHQDLDVAKSLAQKPLNVWLQKKAQEEKERREAEAKRLREEAEQKAREAEQLAAADMDKEAEQTLKKAVQVEGKADLYEKSAQSGKGLAASRGQDGGVASMRKKWVGEISDINHLDIEQLREYISRDALQQALNRFVATGGRNLRGASIYEKTEAVVR